MHDCGALSGCRRIYGPITHLNPAPCCSAVGSAGHSSAVEGTRYFRVCDTRWRNCLVAPVRTDSGLRSRRRLAGHPSQYSRRVNPAVDTGEAIRLQTMDTAEPAKRYPRQYLSTDPDYANEPSFHRSYNRFIRRLWQVVTRGN